MFRVCSNIQQRKGHKMEFTTTKVLNLLDLNRNTFQDWMDRKLIKPSIQKSSKQGEPNIFSKKDLYAIYLFNRLVNFGISRMLAKDHANITFDNVGDGKDQIKYSVLTRGYVPGLKGGRIQHDKVYKTPPTVSLQSNEMFGLVINLLAIKKEVDDLIR